MRKRVLIFLIACLSCSGLFAQTEESDTLDVNAITSFDPGYDTSAVEVIADTNARYRDFFLSADTLRKWKNSEEYAWIKSIDSLLKRAAENGGALPMAPKKIVLQKNGKRSGGGSSNSSSSSSSSSSVSVSAPAFLQPLLWILAIGIVLFVIVKLFLNGGFFSGRRRNKKIKTESVDEDPAAEEEEVISDRDFDALRKKALRENNFRLATRYLFLSLLRDLISKEKVRYAADKTNSMYMRELPADLQNGFASVSLYYEYIWYGNAAIDKEIYDRVEQSFDHFSKSVR